MFKVCAILTDTISAIHLLVFPLSSLIVIGRSSLILSNAAGQSSYKNVIANTKVLKIPDLPYIYGQKHLLWEIHLL